MPHQPRSIDRIVAEQVERWRLERARADRPEARPLPVVAISRQYGSQGAAVGKLVAERLGFSFWDHELVDEVAKSAHTLGAMVGIVDEHHHDAVLAGVRDLLQRQVLGQSEYFREVVRVAQTITAHGAAVMVGRGIGLMLKSESVLNVRVVCPLDGRVEGLMKRKQLDRKKAEAEIKAADEERRAFIRDHLMRDVDDPAGYHLQVSTGVFTLAQAAEVVVAAYQQRFGEALAARPSP